MLRWRSGNTPSIALDAATSFNVECIDHGRRSRQLAAAIDMNPLAERMVDARNPIVREHSFGLVQDSVN